MLRYILIIFLTLSLAACTSATIPLDESLTARMDSPNAQLDRTKSLSIINHLRATKSNAPLSINAALNSQANEMAAKYALSGKRPKKPNNIGAMQISAGYANFANTFSGWRSNKASTNSLTNKDFSNAGIGVAYNANSTHGVYWVLLLD